MKLLDNFYKILDFTISKEGVSALVKIEKNHSVFSGHFPNHPVTPGVCTIQIIKELAEKWLEKSIILKSARNVKFMAIINPEITEDVQFDLIIDENLGNEISVKSTVFIEKTIALKFGGVFKII